MHELVILQDTNYSLRAQRCNDLIELHRSFYAPQLQINGVARLPAHLKHPGSTLSNLDVDVFDNKPQKTYKSKHNIRSQMHQTPWQCTHRPVRTHRLHTLLRHDQQLVSCPDHASHGTTRWGLALFADLKPNSSKNLRCAATNSPIHSILWLNSPRVFLCFCFTQSGLNIWETTNY